MIIDRQISREKLIKALTSGSSSKHNLFHVSTKSVSDIKPAMTYSGTSSQWRLLLSKPQINTRLLLFRYSFESRSSHTKFEICKLKTSKENEFDLSLLKCNKSCYSNPLLLHVPSLTLLYTLDFAFYYINLSTKYENLHSISVCHMLAINFGAKRHIDHIYVWERKIFITTCVLHDKSFLFPLWFIFNHKVQNLFFQRRLRLEYFLWRLWLLERCLLLLRLLLDFRCLRFRWDFLERLRRGEESELLDDELDVLDLDVEDLRLLWREPLNYGLQVNPNNFTLISISRNVYSEPLARISQLMMSHLSCLRIVLNSQFLRRL